MGNTENKKEAGEVAKKYLILVDKIIFVLLQKIMASARWLVKWKIIDLIENDVMSDFAILRNKVKKSAPNITKVLPDRGH